MKPNFANMVYNVTAGEKIETQTTVRMQIIGHLRICVFQMQIFVSI